MKSREAVPEKRWVSEHASDHSAQVRLGGTTSSPHEAPDNGFAHPDKIETELEFVRSSVHVVIVNYPPRIK